MTVFLFFKLPLNNVNTNTNNTINKAINDSNNISAYNSIKEDLETEDINIEKTWKIKIPKINLEAKISEGTDEKVLNEYVGHFEETPKDFGNVGLAAHNRGYKVNYFSRIKELNIGDKIYYQYNFSEKIYQVVEEKIIKDTDWKVLENTNENYLTLITCLENKPEERRCIIAKEVNKNN